MSIEYFALIQDMQAAGAVALNETLKPFAYVVRDSQGLFHRTDGPAYVTSDGYQAWYMNGTYHRIGGPARMWSNGYCEYWTHGTYVISGKE